MLNFRSGRKTRRRANIATLSLALSLLFFFDSASAHASLVSARVDYDKAIKALRAERWSEYTNLRSTLNDYPLALYLDYYQLTQRISSVSVAQAQGFLDKSANTPLYNRFLSAYLTKAGQHRRWKDFLAVAPAEPNNVSLKCYYFRAQRAQGHYDVAWEGASRLWLHGSSQPKACDPLFDTWRAAGKLNDQLVWDRLLLAFKARQSTLMKYLAKLGSTQLRPRANLLLDVYRDPASLERLSLSATSPYAKDIATYGLMYLARYNPEKALVQYKRYSQHMTLSEEQTRLVEYEIALRSLFARTTTHRPWLYQTLDALNDDKLVGIRLRWALAEQDWRALEQTLPLLSAEERDESVWHYWKAIALKNRGDIESANALLESLSADRGYYSFLAADLLGKPYAFNQRPVEAQDFASLSALPVIQRIEELHFHREDNLAHSEWYKALQVEQSTEIQQQLAALAAQRGWHRMGIDAATRAKAWDALSIRFPPAYSSQFSVQAQSQQLASTELMAIARRESAFFPQARSSVGARGLMQIMPATGKQVASSIGKRYSTADLYDAEKNIHLGSVYYRQLLERFAGNRVFALAGYNAGPHRVDRWRKASGGSISVALWVETIPFQETRKYVQAVLAYNVVFQYLLGEEVQTLLTPQESSASY